ncbi:MAG TPA: glycosyltransferase, partial [Sphingomicrobium sp.]
MTPALLTIGIPTYNRADTIRANLGGIVDRLPDWVEILVCDNASDPSVTIDVATLATAAARGIRIRIVRHPTNLGAPANILRLFELVETPWLLLAGDDDPVL